MSLPPPPTFAAAASPALFAPYGVTWYPARRRKKTPVWAEEKPSILSVLKFDSEVQDPGRQKANGGGGKKDTDGRWGFFFTVRRVNLPNTLRPPTKVSPLMRRMFLSECSIRRALHRAELTQLCLWTVICSNCCWMATKYKVSELRALWMTCVFFTHRLCVGSSARGPHLINLSPN